MKELLKLARETIKAKLEGKKLEVSEEVKEKFSKEQACFVTLTKRGNLRGCIGSLEPRQELWKDVMANSINAGFHDPRFPPVEKDELKDIKIEVSVLSVPEKLDYKNEKELLKKINKNMGIILKKGVASATFLPQVWEELSDKIEFLEHLSMKAGLKREEWKDSEFWDYTVEKEKE